MQVGDRVRVVKAVGFPMVTSLMYREGLVVGFEYDNARSEDEITVTVVFEGLKYLRYFSAEELEVVRIATF